MKVTDILLDEDNELMERNGDIVVGDSTKQHQKHLLLLDTGNAPQALLSGVGIMNYVDDEGPDALYRQVRSEFVKDGMTVNDLSIGTDKSINVDANY